MLIKGEYQFNNGKFGREDISLFLSDSNELSLLADNVTKAVEGRVRRYMEDFPELKTFDLYNESIKFQKTKEGSAGYSTWHSERSGMRSYKRCFVWLLYLNDVEKGGETEFLYQAYRHPPKAGDLIIWPAGYTHLHRGNPPLSEDKYILTGGFSYTL